VTVNDTQIFGAMIEGVELVANLITRCSILEKLYLQTTLGANAAANDQLVKAILGLYVAVLRYLSKARRYYDRRTYSTSIHTLLRFSICFCVLMKG
jgi:hypothetical protein